MRIEELVTVILVTFAIFVKNLPLGAVLLSVLVVYITFVYGDFIYRSYLTLNRDLRYTWRCSGTETLFSGLALILDIKWDLWRRLRQNKGLHEIFLENVRHNERQTAIIDIETGRQLTFDQLNKEANRIANYFQVGQPDPVRSPETGQGAEVRRRGGPLHGEQRRLCHLLAGSGQDRRRLRLDQQQPEEGTARPLRLGQQGQGYPHLDHPRPRCRPPPFSCL